MIDHPRMQDDASWLRNKVLMLASLAPLCTYLGSMSVMIFGQPPGIADAAWSMRVIVGMPTELHPTRRVEILHLAHVCNLEHNSDHSSH